MLVMPTNGVIQMCKFINQAPVVQSLDNAIHRINRYPMDKCQQKTHAIRWIVIYLVDSVIHLSNNPGQCYSCTIFMITWK